MKLKRVKEIVKECLEEDSSTRNSDTKLYVKVCEKIGINVQAVTLEDMRNNPSSFPTYESISRARRKYQSMGMFEAEQEVKSQRFENKKEYLKEFA